MKPLFLIRNVLIFFLIVVAACLCAVTVRKIYKSKFQKEPVGFFENEKQQEVIKKNVFKDREIIKFGIYSYGIRVGSGQLNYLGIEEEGGEKYQHIIFKASTLSVKDEDDVKGSLDFSFPVRVDRDVTLFGKKELISERYSSDRRSVNISKIVNGSIEPEQFIQSKDDINNVFLLLYQLRNDEEIGLGKVYVINLPTQKFELVVDSKKKIKVPLGEFDVFYLESRPPKYKIWLQAQESRLPVKIQGLVAGGMLYLAATEVSFQG